MLHYIIDGYNLLHKIRALNNSSSPQLDLIQYIKTKHLTGSRNNKVTIVFDGYDSDSSCIEREYRIIFSKNITADEVIKDIVSKRKNKNQIVVVSDDREIISHARQEGVKTKNTRQFLSNRSKSKQGNANDDRPLSPSSIMEINDELKKIWLK